MHISIKDDFDLQKIAESGQCFRWHMTDARTCRLIAHGKRLQISYGKKPHTIELNCDEEEYRKIWHAYLNMDESYEEIRKRIQKKDHFLQEAAEAQRGIRILRQEPWETLVTFIISQRKSIPAICRAVEELCCAAGGCIYSDKEENAFAFPTATELQQLSLEELKACGLGYRAKYVYAVAALFGSETEDMHEWEQLGDEELYEKLTALPGVGPKVASCVMLFGFHRMNAFPKDVWILRVLKEQYPKGYPYETYAPYNGVMQQFLFAHYRDKNKIRKQEKSTP